MITPVGASVRTGCGKRSSRIASGTLASGVIPNTNVSRIEVTQSAIMARRLRKTRSRTPTSPRRKTAVEGVVTRPTSLEMTKNMRSREMSGMQMVNPTRFERVTYRLGICRSFTGGF